MMQVMVNSTDDQPSAAHASYPFSNLHEAHNIPSLYIPMHASILLATFK